MRKIPQSPKEIPFFVVLLVALACIVGPAAGEDGSTVPPETLAHVETVTNATSPMETETPPDAALVLSIAADPPDGTVPLTVHFTGTATGVAVDIWEWTIDGVAADADGPDLTHTFLTSGTYTVALTATNTTLSLANTTAVEVVAEEIRPLVRAARAGIVHPHIWNVSKIAGAGNYTSLLDVPEIGDGDTVRIWGMAESAEDRIYEGGIVIGVPDVTVKQWEGSPAQPLITTTSAVGPSAVAPMSPGPAAPAFTVTADNATFRGLTLSGNRLNGNGAGIHAVGSDEVHIRGLTVTDCTFTGNAANGGAAGGALSAEYVDDLQVERTEFTDNTATYGGGAYFLGCTNAALTGVTFTDNEAEDCGGGADFWDSSGITLSGVTFTNNTAATYGGGADFYTTSDTVLTGITFTNNTAANSGGGANFYTTSDTVLTDATFTNNTAANSGGGAAFGWCDNATLTRATFENNRAEFSGSGPDIEPKAASSGPEISYCGGGAYFYDTSDAVLTDTAFTNNTAANSGGGAYFEDCANAALTGTTFLGNTATYYGGGTYFGWCEEPTLADAIFTGNTAIYGGGAYFEDSANATLTDATFTGNTAIYGGGAYFEDCANATLTDATFTGNTATYCGGGAAFWGCGDTTITGTAFTENDATYGGGAAFGGCGDTTITGTTFIDNTVTDHDLEMRGLKSSEEDVESSGGAVYFMYCEDTTITNCRFDNPTNIYAEGGFEGPTLAKSDIIEHFSAVLNTTRTPGTNIAVGPYLGGNLWLNDPTQNISEWCADADFDGICDEPLTIAMNGGEEFGTDYLPLVYGGTVAIASTPAGASVHLDGVAVNRTTDASLYLPVGDHTVTVTLDGYVTPATRTVTVVPGETVPVSFALQPVSSPSSGSGGGHSDLSAASAGLILSGGSGILAFQGPAIYEIRVAAGETIQDLLVTIGRSGLPSGVNAPTGTIFEYDEVTLYHTTDDAVEGALILFSIPKAWLEENGIDPADVVLYRYHDGAWQALPTEVTDEDATSWHFSAQSPGFSLFAIGGDPSPVAVKAPDAGAQAGTTEPLPPVTETPASPPAETPQPFPTMILILCGAAVLLIVAVVLRTRR
ncbi:right-handed parallel beta-helix repeat-containing protein [Methanofollis ethanolicus]|uniref:right-handed parallel beta-helix repeat-containing protein n=1 Tax=Methanofollis ethanolicus TaxID=488124 RepID=UPI000836BF22|nr:right-handed parallel beta-helix repeat-containing protein [Methanofollis ethanolicus]